MDGVSFELVEADFTQMRPVKRKNIHKLAPSIKFPVMMGIGIGLRLAGASKRKVGFGLYSSCHHPEIKLLPLLDSLHRSANSKGIVA